MLTPDKRLISFTVIICCLLLPVMIIKHDAASKSRGNIGRGQNWPNFGLDKDIKMVSDLKLLDVTLIIRKKPRDFTQN